MSAGAVIVAAGRGERIGGATPKQLLRLGDRSILQRSVEAFDRHAEVSEIVVVLPVDLLPDASAIVGPTSRPCQVVAGGRRRQDSVRCGVDALSGQVDVILIHDAARPFVTADVIDRVIAAAREGGAAVPALAARDTIKRAPVLGGAIQETLPRAEVFLAQTPQGFRRDVLRAVWASADAGVDVTDDAQMAERAGYPVRLVEGSERNMKITTADDLAAARAALTPAPRVGTGYDLHRLVEGRPLVLAGVVVPFERGPFGHSDGDVVCHALTDALLGAAGAGDIGQLFPDSDPRWKGAAGLDLLGRTVAVVHERGFEVASGDVTVVLERPKLASYVLEIRERIAGVLGVARDAVSVKAKTNEGTDAVGRGEAIAAHAIAVIVARRGR